MDPCRRPEGREEVPPHPAPQPSPVVLDPADPRWADLVASFDELERGGGVTLTAEEAEHYFETGDLGE